MSVDDELYERFVEESNARRIREQAHETQQTQEQLQQELQVTLSGILLEIEQERIDGGLHRTQGTHNMRNVNSNGVGGVNRENFRPPFSFQRRPMLRTFLRNLLVLDYFVLLLLFPFSLYNVLKSGFSSMTFSSEDFIKEVVCYFRFVKVFSEKGNSLLIYKDDTIGLLGKFHNIIIYNSSPMIETILKTTTNNKTIEAISLKLCHFWVKITTTTIYLVYGLGGTVYLFAAGFFFLLCFTLATIRRYKYVHQILVNSMENLSTVPGMY